MKMIASFSSRFVGESGTTLCWLYIKSRKVNTVASGRKVRTLFEVLHLNWQNKSEQRKSRRPRRWSARVKRLLIGINEHFWRATTDPYKMGWIACNNVISDLYAMGVSRIDNVLMLLSTSTKFTDKQEDAVLPQIMSGFRDCCFAAGTQVRGGQTTRNPWVLLGGCATSVLPKNEFVLPNGAKAGDLLVLTKPLGTQIAVNLNQWLDDQDMDKLKATGMNEDEIRKGYDAATVSMMTLNREASSLMRKYKAHAATDVTGFGILGHAQNLVECQEDELDFVIDKLPILEKIASADDGMGRMFQLVKGYSAETSGGLLLAIDPIEAAKYITDLKAANGHDIWIIGKVTAGSRKAKIVHEVQIIDVTLNENEKLVSN